MRAALSIALTLVATSAYAQEAPTEEAAHTPAQSWTASSAIGVSNVTQPMPGMQLMGTAQRSTTMPGETTSSLEPTILFSLHARLGKRLVWSVPTLSAAYKGGTRGEREWIPWAGLTSWSLGYSTIEHLIFDGQVGAGIALREWVQPSTAINVTGGASSELSYRGVRFCATGEMCPAWHKPTTWTASASVGISHALTDGVMLHVGTGASRTVEWDGNTSVSFGSVQAVGLRQLPLLQARLTDRWFVDGYAAASYDLGRDRLEQRYLIGFTRVWPE